MSCFLVTGGCGFIGSHLVDRLTQEKHQVIVLDDLSSGKRENLPNSAKFIVGDVCDRELLMKIFDRIDGCFHLAAILGIDRCTEDWLGSNKTNLTGTITIFDVASYYYHVKNKVIPVIYTSSCAVYGDAVTLPLDEAMHITPISSYGADKLACELYGNVASLVHHVPTIGLRLFNVYGQRQDPTSPYSAVIPIFIDHILKKKAIEVFGDGEQTRDFIAVSDVIDHFVFFMNHSAQFSPGVFNVCTGSSHSLHELIKYLQIFLNEPARIVYKPKRVGDVLHSRGNPAKAIACGISAKMSFENGLKNYCQSMVS